MELEPEFLMQNVQIFATAPEIIIRDDADDGDVGYTWGCTAG